MAYCYYGETKSNNDSLIHNALERPGPIQPIPEFGLIIIDEAQDMKPLFYDFVKLICKQMSSSGLQMILLGDPFQQIYGFSGADVKYMLRAEEHFGSSLPQNSFKYFHFTICWRITHEMAEWINQKLNATNLCYACDPKWDERREDILRVWGKGIQANPNRGPAPGSVVYLNCQATFAALVDATDECFNLYGPSGCAVISRAVNGPYTPAKRLVSAMGHRDWEVLCRDSPKEVSANKYIAASIHKFKGLERDAIVVLGLDAYFENFDGALQLFNLFYVAATRARQQLVIAQINRDPFVTIRKTPTIEWSESTVRVINVYGLLEFVPYMPEMGEEAETQWIEPIVVQELPWNRRVFLDTKHTKVPGRSPWKIEDTTPLYKISLQIALCLVLGHSLPAIRQMDMEDEESKDFWWKKVEADLRCNLSDFHERWPSGSFSLAEAAEGQVDDALWWDLMRLANAYHTAQTCYTHQWRQIVHYETWVDCRTLSMTLANSIKLLSDLGASPNVTPQQRIQHLCHRVKFQTPISLTWTNHISICGIVDLTLDGHVVQIRFENQLKMSHLLQARAYSSIYTLQTYRTSVRQTNIQSPNQFKREAYVMVPNLGLLCNPSLTKNFYTDGVQEVEQNIWDAFKFIEFLVARKLTFARTEYPILKQRFQTFLAARS